MLVVALICVVGSSAIAFFEGYGFGKRRSESQLHEFLDDIVKEMSDEEKKAFHLASVRAMDRLIRDFEKFLGPHLRSKK